MHVGERIRFIRTLKKMNQIEASHGICSNTYFSKMENHYVKPGESLLIPIAERLGIDAGLLLSDVIYDENRVNEIAELFWRTGRLGNNELLYFTIVSRESLPTGQLVKVFGVLMRHYVNLCLADLAHKEQARELFELSEAILPKLQGDQFYPDYFNYMLACSSYHADIALDHVNSYKYMAILERRMDAYTELDKARLHYNISLVLDKILEEKSIALAYSAKAYDYFKETKDTHRFIMVMLARGIQFHKVGMLDDSLKMFTEAEQLVDDKNAATFAPIIEFNLGIIYELQQRHDQAIEKFRKCLLMHERRPNQQVYCYRRIAQNALKLKSWPLLEECLLGGMALAEELGMMQDYLEMTYLRNQYWFMKQDLVKYEKEMKRLVDSSLHHEKFTLCRQYADELGQYYYDRNAYKKAAELFKIANDAAKRYRQFRLELGM